jgi:shikimate kinase/3-dehydroquinate synthase
LSREADRTYPEKNIFLTGFMGSGKSTVGRLLAESLNRPFVDMDAELTKYHNKSVSEVFAESGEAYFRQTETGLLKKLNGQDQPKVIATGGGIVESQYNCDILKGALTFFLNLPAEAAWERVDDENRGCRPLAADPVAFKALHAKRLGLYAKCGAEFSALPSPSKVRDNILDFILYQEPFELSAEGKTCLIRTYAPASGAAQLLGEILGPSKAMVLMDHRFRDEPDAFNGALADVPVVYAKHRGEEAKTLAEATDVLLAMAEAKLDRSDYLLVRGGGSLTDLGALCAGLYRRGLNLILVPTTLLAAVDAAIGGKAAVNLAGAKNQVGLFHLPKEVWLDPLVLRGLPGELWREGLVEAYKTALLFDPILQAMIARQINNVLAGDLLLLSQIAHDSARHKANLVAKDLREELGLRDVLNLGHTYGHAVESFYAPHLSHGRAVALGLAVALIYSRDRHGFDPELAKNAIGVCRRLAGGAFPDPPPDAETAKLLGFDKKIRGGQLKFVALKAPGESVVDPSVPVGDILEAVRGLSKDAREA